MGAFIFLAKVGSAENAPTTTPFNTTVIIQDYSHNDLPYQPVRGIFSPAVNSHISADLDIETSVITYDTTRSTLSKGDTDTGYYPFDDHRIELDDERQFKQSYRHIRPSLLNEVRQHTDKQLSVGIIRISYSPFSSNVVLVRKKN